MHQECTYQYRSTICSVNKFEVFFLFELFRVGRISQGHAKVLLLGTYRSIINDSFVLDLYLAY